MDSTDSIACKQEKTPFALPSAWVTITHLYTCKAIATLSIMSTQSANSSGGIGTGGRTATAPRRDMDCPLPKDLNMIGAKNRMALMPCTQHMHTIEVTTDTCAVASAF